MYFAFYKMMHIISFTAWFAGTFYIWRLFVYHAET
ncbi:MAG TPA: CopD family protein, partial [Leptospiraceae bacterium]|nr:CopD family protein [Leptospiraceae bacterium]